jgi:hypothetical protein
VALTLPPSFYRGMLALRNFIKKKAFWFMLGRLEISYA